MQYIKLAFDLLTIFGQELTLAQNFEQTNQSMITKKSE